VERTSKKRTILVAVAGWDEYHGTVTRAFDEWRGTDLDVRSFLSFGLRASASTYERQWEEAGEQPAWPGGPERPDHFHDRIDGLWPHDFDWMLMAAVLKDGVTAFEVYLEKAMEEMLRAHGGSAPAETNARTPSWEKITVFYKRAVGIHLKGDQVLRDVRDLRHILTHKRGGLRTDEDRERFGKDEDGWIGDHVQLTRAATVEHLDVLAGHVRRVDPLAYAVAWAGHTPDGLLDYIKETRTAP
jgi:hypothetical protein